jgi:ubiquinone/menaquinone biosynthesis C-methylase UbiE
VGDRGGIGDNVDRATVEGFGEEWSTYDQAARSAPELRQTFERYFSVFPWEHVRADAVGLDAGCGSGRWARFVAPRVGSMIAVDPSAVALTAARRTLGSLPGVVLVRGAAGALPFADRSMDFGYSLGVLHHTPDPAAGLTDCVRCLKPGAPFLVYVYYALDGRPAWFRALWRASDVLRSRISRLSAPVRHRVCTVIAAVVYLPLARIAPLLRRLGVRDAPLSAYQDKPFAVMRTDAFDRFGTPLEHRFTRQQVVEMMSTAGLTDIRVRDEEPYWCASGVTPLPTQSRGE